MSKIEPETIAPACLERLKTGTATARQNQDEKIGKIETRVEDFERQLTRPSASLRDLQPLTDGFERYVIERRKTVARERERERQPRGMGR